MSSKNSDDGFKEENDIEQYSQNDKAFRAEITFQKFESLRRATLAEIDTPADYTAYLQGVPDIVFIDLWDILKFLKIKHSNGFDAIDIKAIAEIVCDYLGSDSDFQEVLYTTFDEDIASVIIACLGIDGDGPTWMLSQPFNTAMEILVEIGSLIRRYLINAEYPLIGDSSVFKVADSKNGILALKLRNYDELL